MAEKDKQAISSGDVGTLPPPTKPRQVMSGDLTVRRAEATEPEPLEDGRPAYEPESPTGEKILSREEVMAKTETESPTAEVNLYSADGNFLRTLNLPKEFATRFVQFSGRRYEKVSENQWQDVGEEQPLKA